MKIIKRNKKHLWVECDRCGSILEPKEKDFEEYTSTTQKPDVTIIQNDTLYVLTIREQIKCINCPVCGHEIRVSATKKESYEWF